MVILTERKLLRLTDDETLTEIASIDDKKSPFEIGDIFCVAPLAVLNDTLYAGGQRGGDLYRLE